MPASVGGNASKQRSYSIPPETGTLTTSAIPAWAPSTAYVVDATGSGVNTVTNGGNLYQCVQGGTSASSGGPTGTGTNITDGTAHWKYIGANPSQDVSAGSQIIAIVARGTQSTVPGGVIQPNDNDTGGTYTTISNTNYSGFTDSFAGLFRRPSASNAKVGFATNAQWGGTSVGSGAGDEITSMWVELKNVQVGAPHTFAQVERANGTNGIVTGPTITTTVPCLILSVWFGNGTVLTAGQSHTAVPIGGLQEISGCNRLISLSTSGYIQVNAAWRIAAPGTFAEQWQTGVGTSEGAQVVTVAYQDLSTISIGDDEQAPPRQVSRALAGALALVAGVAAEELPPQTAPATVDDETSFIMRRSALGWQSGVFAATDELAPAMLEDEPALAARPWPAPRWISYQAAPDEELASWAIEEDTASSAASQLLQTWTLRVQWPAEDEMPTFVVASPMVEDEPAFPIPVWPAISASPLLAAAEELASGLLPDHVRITGISPDPEVYGEMPLNQEIYGGS